MRVRKWNELEWNRNGMEGKGRELGEVTGCPGISRKFNEATGRVFWSVPSEVFESVSRSKCLCFASCLKTRVAVGDQETFSEYLWKLMNHSVKGLIFLVRSCL